MKPAYDTGLKGINQRLISDGVYMISPKGFHDKVLTINYKEKLINFRSLTKEARQFFYIKYNDSLDYYTITSLHSQRLLGIKDIDNSEYKNPEIGINYDSESNLTKWQIDLDNEYIFKLNDFNYYLQYNTETKSPFLSKKDNTDAHKFYLYPSKIIETGFYSIKSIVPKNLFITFSNEDKNLYLSSNKNDNQLFYIVFDEKDGCYSIINIQNQKCFSPGENPKIISKIKQSDFYNLDHQKWIIGTKDNSNYFLLPKTNIGIMLCNSNSNNNNNEINVEFKATDRPDITFNDNFQFQLQSSSFDFHDALEKIKKILEIRYIKSITDNFDIFKIKLINDQIFANSFFLTSLEIPTSISKIFENAFANCLRIKHIKCAPKWLKLLPNKINVENIIIQDGSNYADIDSFKGFHNLKYLELPSSFEYNKCDPDIFSDIYGLQTFKGDPIFLELIQKDELMSLHIPLEVEEIPEGICANCKSLNEVIIEEDSCLKVIKPRAFAGCKLLKSFPTPPSVEDIAPDAFENCNKDFVLVYHNDKQRFSNQSKLIIGPDVNRITYNYKKYINITSIDIHVNVQKCDSNVLKSFEKIKFVKCAPKFLHYFQTEKIESVSIPDEVTEINKEDFENLIHLKRLIIPQSVTNIEKGAFDNCKELTSVESCIHHLEFLNQNQIKSIILDKSTECININDFRGFVNLEYCKIPHSLQDIDPDSFENCKKLMKIDHPRGNSFINNYVKVDKNEILRKEFEGWSNIKVLKIKDSVENIEKDTFKDCINIKYLESDPKWFSYIPKFSIRKVYIPESVEELNGGEFDEFYSMDYIYLPKDIIINDSSIFDSCKCLRKIECNTPILTKLSEVTVKRLNNKIQVRYENPIFNFQPNRRKIHDETHLARSIPLNTSMSYDRSIVRKMFYSIRRGSSRGTKMQFRKPDLSIDALIESDKDALKYKISIFKVISNMESDDPIDDVKPKGTKLSDISSVCGYVCYKIFSQNDKIRMPNVVQIYTILRLANKILNDDVDEHNKGSIAEIRAGEGKTLIIAILAIILVKFGRKVDIVTSNIWLAKQDRENNSSFFNLFDINTAVFYDLLNDPEELTQSANLRKHESIDESEIEHFNVDALDCPVVYSNSRNYEFYYLNHLFDLNPRKRDLDVLLINEVDNMLIDELDTPAAISKDVNFDSCSKIFKKVYKNRALKPIDVTKELKQAFHNTCYYDEQDISLLVEIAREAENNKEKDIDYCVENDKIVIIDKDTGFKMANYRWPNYVYEMVKVKENVKFKSLPVSICQITQQTYFTHYKKIAAVTGTIGSPEDEKTLIEGYNVEVFKVPRNIPTEIDITYRKRSKKNIFSDVINEIIEEASKDRPILVIWDNESNANKFLEEVNNMPSDEDISLLENVQKVFGKDLEKDKEAIENAGETGTITFTTSNALKRVDIELSKESLDAGGLHVIVPMKIPNIRSLEQAVGAAGRRGEPGSATIYINKKDIYAFTPLLNHKNSNLDKYQTEFAHYIRNNFKWMLYELEKQKLNDNITFPFAANYSDILTILSKHIYLAFNGKSVHDDNVIKNNFRRLAWLMTQTAWGVFFTSLQNDKYNIDDPIYCQREYNRFIAELSIYLSPDKSRTIDNAYDFIKAKFTKEKIKDHTIYRKFIISSYGVKSLPKLVNKNQSNNNAANNYNDDNDDDDNNNNNNDDDVVVLDSSAADSSNNNDGEKKKSGSFFGKLFGKAKDLIHFIQENKKNIPNESIHKQSPKVDSDIDDIELIRDMMTFANEAYGDGTFSKGRLLYSSTINDLYKPVFFVLEYYNKLFVVIRGSNSTVDWITDMTCNEILKEINGLYIHFHYGFYMAANYVLNKTERFLRMDYSEIYFVGHSYAAAVCNVSCLLTKTNEEFKHRKVFSYAFAPPPSMSKIPASVQNCMFNFINKEDIVPHMSMINIRNSMDIDKIGIENFISNHLQSIKSLPISYAKVLAESAEKYKQHLLEVLKSAKGELHVSINRGNIYLIGFESTTQLYKNQVDEAYFLKKSKLHFSDHMFSDHSMLDYIKSFEKIKSYKSKI